MRLLQRYPAFAVPRERPGAALADSYRRCRDITRAASKTFYFASLFLPARKRKAIWAVYAFCRTVDDIADAPGAPGLHLAALDAWEAELVRAFSGRPDAPVMVAVAETARIYGVPIEPALALLAGARKDITVQRYATYAELLDYCYLVASTVGLLVSPILGYAPGALGYGVALGRAMQLTNILRDVGEDARMGRIYLPAEDLAPVRLLRGRELLRGVVDADFVALMRFEITRVRALYRAAAPGSRCSGPRRRYTVRLALAIYGRILDAIEANGYNVFTRRAYVPVHAKLGIALTTALVRS